MYWDHVASTAEVTYLEAHEKRGTQALEGIGIYPNREGPVVHDGYKSYYQFDDLVHVLCNAHHLRELEFVHEQYKQEWADDLAKLLKEIKKAVKVAGQQGQITLSQAQLVDFDSRYDELLKKGYDTNPPPEEPPPKKRGRKKQTKPQMPVGPITGPQAGSAGLYVRF